MQIEISTNCPQIAGQLAALSNRVPVLARKATIDATTILYMGSRGLLSSLIYDVPIPKVSRRKRRANGKLGPARMVALWKRTSQLLRGEKQTLINSGADVIGIIDNATPYAAARHAQTKRPAPWRDEAMRQYGARARDAFQQAFNALN